MVTFKPIGRLGNFLFEAASAIAYAWENGLEYSIPTRTNDEYWNPVYLPHLANSKYDPNLPSVTVAERVFNHHARIFKSEWKDVNVILEGYWQTEKYFKHHRPRVLEAFAYPWEPQAGHVSVHVRRGDYLTIKKGRMLKHPPVSVEWYRAQMSKFPGATFCFYSDDIGWCEREFGREDNALFAPWFTNFGDDERRSAEECDLVSMSCCEHHICSASTFSWWAAWLDRNPSKRVIMPKHWITPGWSNLNMADVVPKEWERI